MHASTNELRKTLETAIGLPVLYVKGVFVAKGGARYTIAQARKLTGLAAPEHNLSPRVGAWGDWATIAAINGAKL